MPNGRGANHPNIKDYIGRIVCPRCRGELDAVLYRLDSYNKSVHFLVCPSGDCYYEDANFSQAGVFSMALSRFMPFDKELQLHEIP